MSDFPEHDLSIATPVKSRTNTPQELRKARATVAHHSTGLYDRARLLEMLGLIPDGQVLTVVVP